MPGGVGYLGELLLHATGAVASDHGTVWEFDNFGVVGMVDCHNDVALGCDGYGCDAVQKTGFCKSGGKQDQREPRCLASPSAAVSRIRKFAELELKGGKNVCWQSRRLGEPSVRGCCCRWHVGDNLVGAPGAIGDWREDGHEHLPFDCLVERVRSTVIGQSLHSHGDRERSRMARDDDGLGDPEEDAGEEEEVHR